MKTFILLFAFLIVPVAHAQLANTSVSNGSGAPIGACVSGSTYTDSGTGFIYACVSSVWTSANADPVYCNAAHKTDGTTPTVDAGPALRACVAAIPTIGGTVRLIPGRYGISTAVTDAQNAPVALNLGTKDGVRFECGSTGGIHQAGTDAHPCSIELITGIPAGTILISMGTYGAGSYAGPVFSNVSLMDNTATGAGFAVKDTSNSRFEGVYVNGFTYAGLAPPGTPTVTATSGGSLGAGVQVFIVTAYRNAWGISLPSAEASATTAGTCPGSGNCSITVTGLTTPGGGAIDYLVYASTTTLLEKSQEACCTGTAFGANFVISAALSGSGLLPEVSNKTRGTGLSFYGSSGWGNSTGFVNHSIVTDLRAGKDNEIAFVVNPNAVTSINFLGGDMICQSTTAALPCSIVGPTTYLFGTHWESLATKTALQVESHAPNGSRGVSVYGGLMESTAASGTGINCVRCFGDHFEIAMTNLSSGVILDANSGGNTVDIVHTGVSTPVTEGAPGNNRICVNSGCSGVLQNVYMGAAGGQGKLILSNTAPTIAGAGCGGSGASIAAGTSTAAFTVNVGTAPTSGGCLITLPTAATGWACKATNQSTQNTTNFAIIQGSVSTTSATLFNFNSSMAATAPTASNVWQVNCFAY